MCEMVTDDAACLQRVIGQFNNPERVSTQNTDLSLSHTPVTVRDDDEDVDLSPTGVILHAGHYT